MTDELECLKRNKREHSRARWFEKESLSILRHVDENHQINSKALRIFNTLQYDWISSRWEICYYSKSLLRGLAWRRGWDELSNYRKIESSAKNERRILNWIYAHYRAQSDFHVEKRYPNVNLALQETSIELGKNDLSTSFTIHEYDFTMIVRCHSSRESSESFRGVTISIFHETRQFWNEGKAVAFSDDLECKSIYGTVTQACFQRKAQWIF